MTASPLCKCGRHEAVLNKDTGAWELCSECKTKMKHSVICEEIIRLFGKKYAGASLTHFKENLVKSLESDLIENKRNILFTGDSSTGKTYLMAALYKKLCSESYIDASYVNVINLYCIIDADVKKFEELVQEYTSCDVLFLDEYTNPNNTWEERLLYLILENRKNNELITISSTNLNSDSINGRFYSRLIENNGIEYKITRNSWDVK